jgi:hypothetical protein
MTPKKKAAPKPQTDDPYDTFRTPRTIPFLWDVTGWMNDEGQDMGAHNGTAYDTKSRKPNVRKTDAKDAA